MDAKIIYCIWLICDFSILFYCIKTNILSILHISLIGIITLEANLYLNIFTDILKVYKQCEQLTTNIVHTGLIHKQINRKWFRNLRNMKTFRLGCGNRGHNLQCQFQ